MKTTVLPRLLALLLMLCMLVSVFAACATEDEEGSNNATEDGTEAPTLETPTEEITNDVDITLDREVRILYSDYLVGLEVVKEEDIGFNMIEKKTMSRVKYKKTCVDCNDKEVKNEDIVKGYQYEKDKYVIFTNEDFEKLKTPKDKNISIENFRK